MTLGERLALCNNRPAGFDWLRFGLASLVIFTHTTDVVYGPAYALAVWQGPWRAPLAMILPMFFALSGFLVAGSLERCATMVSFLGLRVIRLVPALAVDTAIAALVFGPMFTVLPLDHYFSSPLLPAYALNIVGDVHYVLPGVFLTNPWAQTVNAQLWTLPYELMCYAALTLLAVLGVVRRRIAFALAVAGLWALILIKFLPFAVDHADRIGTAMPPVLLLCFLGGVAGYLFRDRITFSRPLALASLIAVIALMARPFGDFLAFVPVVYLTVWIGLQNPARHWIVASGDYSYGMFLYGFPVQQATVALIGAASWQANLGIAYAATLALAIFSWRCVEKPALRLRPWLLRVEAAAMRAAGHLPYGARIMQAPLKPA